VWPSVPAGIAKELWGRLQPAEHFYLKLLEMEARGLKTLDNYPNFAKAFKVANFDALMASERANEARLKSASELGRGEMFEGSELHATLLRGALYAVMELAAGVDGSAVLAHLPFHIPNYYDQRQRDGVAALADYLAGKWAAIRAESADVISDSGNRPDVQGNSRERVADSRNRDKL
jgi:putative DNA methylase